ncbi:ATP binding protein [Aureococcus anophagefferens]|uniref:ATP binding protein n=1 Tax=Aureococcus anophagefferens TaxID=44056 RepID=A0ABR1FVS1_AURAN
MPAHHVRGSANKENRREHGGGLKRNASAAKSSFGPPKGSHPSAVSFEVGDRVSVKMDKTSVCPGDVRFVGPSGGRTVVGIRLDGFRSGLGDGKRSSGERHFRCEAIFASPSQCTLLCKKASLPPPPPPERPAAEKPAKKSPPPDKPKPSKGVAAAPSKKKLDPPPQPFDLEVALKEIVGLESVKDMLRSLRNRLVVGKKRAAFGIKDDVARAFVVVGSDGANFEHVARVLCGMLHDLGLLSRNKLEVVKKHDLIKSSTAATLSSAQAAVNAVSDRGGLLLVTDAGGLANGDRDHSRNSEYAKVALEALVSAATTPLAKTQGYAVLFTTRGSCHATLLRSCPALGAASPITFELAEYTLTHVARLLQEEVKVRGFALSGLGDDDDGDGDDDYAARELACLERILAPKLSRCGPDGGGCNLVRAAVDDAVRKQTNRVYAKGTVSKESLLALTAEDFSADDDGADGESAVADALKALDGITGLGGVKSHVRALAAQIELDARRRMAGMRGSVRGSRNGTCNHMIFHGNPGTGKTTVARVVAGILRALGQLRRGHLVEVDRSGLVAAYQGQTAIKVNEVVSSALGGMLFVDEAYALVKDPKDTFGREALDALIKQIEDHRDDLVVVLAGYSGEMKELLQHNPGVKSRFPTVIHFEDYDAAELLAIARSMLEKQELRLSAGAEAKMAKILEGLAARTGVDNGNGRAVRNLIEMAARKQAVRIAEKRHTLQLEDLQTLDEADFDV